MTRAQAMSKNSGAYLGEKKHKTSLEIKLLSFM